MEMDEELLAASRRGGVCHRQRDAEQGVGPQPRLVGRAVEGDHRGVDRGLVVDLHAQHDRGDLARDMADGPPDPPAAMTRALRIAELDRLVPPRARPRRDDRPPAGAVRRGRLHLHRRPASRVEHLAGDELC